MALYMFKIIISYIIDYRRIALKMGVLDIVVIYTLEIEVLPKKENILHLLDLSEVLLLLLSQTRKRLNENFGRFT